MTYLIDQLENLVTEWQKNVQSGSGISPLAEVCGILSEDLKQKVLARSGPEQLLFYSDVAKSIMDALKPEKQKMAKDLLARKRYDLKDLLESLNGNTEIRKRRIKILL